MLNLTTLLFKTTFSDISIEMNNYDVDSENIVLSNDVDYIYTGLYKKFKNLFIGIDANAIAGVLKFEYYNGTTWTALNVIDQTKDFSRSGFIAWDLPDDWAATTINGKELFYIRITADIDVTINGINMVFANDNDLKEHYRSIMDYKGNDNSFIALHQASKKDIIQKIRNSGKTKISSIDGTMTDLTIWDFMRPDQLRNAAAYLCLSKIFAGVSDNADGKFLTLSRTFRKEYQNAVDTFLVNVDFNDNGLEDVSEQAQSISITRIVTV